MDSKEEIAQTEEQLRSSASKAYQAIAFKKRGGTRDVFQSEWGPSRELRVMKVDRDEKSLDTPRALRHAQRGCNTKHEQEIAGILQSGERHPNLNRLVDYWELPDGRAVNVYEHFAGTNLEEAVNQKPLTTKEIVATFRDTLSGSKHMTSYKGVVHRDKKPSNILVDRAAIARGNKVVAQITDFANAERLSIVQEKEAQALPTVGGHLVTDPHLLKQFTGQSRKYGVPDEIYQDCADMLFAFHGRHPFEYDADRSIGINHLNGESLLTPEGRLDEDKYESALTMALKKVPRRFRKVIQRGMTGDLSKRYTSLDELANSFEAAAKPRKWKTIIGSVSLAAAIALGAGISAYNSHRAKVEAASTLNAHNEFIGDKSVVYQIVSAVNGEDFEVGNNLFDLHLSAFIEPKPNEGPAPLYPEKMTHILAEPGDVICPIISAVDKPLPADKYGLSPGVPGLYGRAYFEGSEGEAIRIYPENFNRAVITEVGNPNSTPRLKVPKGIKPGNYRIAVELYPPKEGDDYFGKEKFKFVHPKDILARKYIPVRVGKDTPEVALRSLNLDMTNYAYMGGYGKFEFGPRELTTIVEVGGREFRRASNTNASFEVPQAAVGVPIPVKISAEVEGRIVYRTVGLATHFDKISPYVTHMVPPVDYYKTLQQLIPFPEEKSEK